MIHIICGEPGAGKTSLLCALAVYSMTINSRNNVEESKTIIDELNNSGYHYNYPNSHVSYTNFYCRSDYIKWFGPRISYDLDGIDFGLEDEDHETKNIFPGAKLFFMEGQSFLDSRKSRFFRNSVSRAYENHRHWGLDIYIDAQRATLIDLNVREISAEIIEVQRQKIKRDIKGNIKEVIWKVRVFSNTQAYEKYLESGKLKNKEYFRNETYTFPGDIFKCYLSENNFALFLDGREEKMFSCEEHISPSYTKKYIDLYNSRHSLRNQKGNGYWQKGV